MDNVCRTHTESCHEIMGVVSARCERLFSTADCRILNLCLVYLALYLVYIVYFISSENVFVANYVFVGTDDKSSISVELFK